MGAALPSAAGCLRTRWSCTPDRQGLLCETSLFSAKDLKYKTLVIPPSLHVHGLNVNPSVLIHPEIFILQGMTFVTKIFVTGVIVSHDDKIKPKS